MLEAYHYKAEERESVKRLREWADKDTVNTDNNGQVLVRFSGYWYVIRDGDYILKMPNGYLIPCVSQLNWTRLYNKPLE